MWRVQPEEFLLCMHACRSTLSLSPTTRSRCSATTFGYSTAPVVCSPQGSTIHNTYLIQNKIIIRIIHNTARPASPLVYYISMSAGAVHDTDPDWASSTWGARTLSCKPQSTRSRAWSSLASRTTSHASRPPRFARPPGPRSARPRPSTSRGC